MRIQHLVSPALAVLAASAVLAGTDAPQAAQQQPARERIDLSKLGPKIGERVPDFSLNDQTGTTRTLKSVMGPKGAMLVFFRSADW